MIAWERAPLTCRDSLPALYREDIVAAGCSVDMFGRIPWQIDVSNSMAGRWPFRPLSAHNSDRPARVRATPWTGMGGPAVFPLALTFSDVPESGSRNMGDFRLAHTQEWCWQI